MTKDKRVYTKEEPEMYDIREGERILHEEEQKANWKDYAEININLNKEMSKLYENNPVLHPSIKPAMHNLMIQRERMNNSFPVKNGEPAPLYALWASGLGVSLGYIAILGLLMWYHTNYMMP